jgi:phosphoglycolate phosphatase
MTRAVFFDLDGCLVDSRTAIAEAVNHALDALGLPRQPPEVLHPYIGPPLLCTFQQLLPTIGGDAADAGVAVDAYRNVYTDLARTLTTAVPGIPEVLADLHRRVPLMVVTSKPVVFAVPILQSLHLDGVFSHVFGPALHALDEPKAVQLSAAVAAAGVAARDATMVGDRRHDIEAARIVGTRSIGVTWGIGERAELVAAGSDVVLEHPADLLPELSVS